LDIEAHNKSDLGICQNFVHDVLFNPISLSGF
jgi:hypothetical protein